jgi:hypothetical protein
MNIEQKKIVHPMRGMFPRHNYVGLHNTALSCWLNSLLQAIYACKPLLQKILSFNCNNPLFLELRQILINLDKRDGAILNIRTFYYSICHTFGKQVGALNDPSELLMDLYTYFRENCGMSFDFFNINQHPPFPYINLVSESDECLQNAINRRLELFVNLKQDAQFIIICTIGFLQEQTGVRNTLPYNGIIIINSKKFRICAITIKHPIHWYTITKDGRFDDTIITEDKDIMNNFIRLGYDWGHDNYNNGNLYFFERVDDSFETGALPPLPKIVQRFVPPPNSGSEATVELGLGFQDNIHIKIESTRDELRKYKIEDKKLRNNQLIYRELYESNIQLKELIDNNLDDIEDVKVIERCLLIRQNAIEKNLQIGMELKRISSMLEEYKRIQKELKEQLNHYLRIFD